MCYDIADDRRLQRICNLMKGLGFHLQYSVFLCRLTWKELKVLKMAIEELIEPSEDDVRIYPLGTSSLVFALGRGPEGAEEGWSSIEKGMMKG
ncbi:MAG TPA: CRISPR-associated endonuclease Cas2 [Armatimonadetes bacterium]|nr:CRISPR-associated endonuclease Cas2 [Armatimonadota bacterium]